MAPTTPLGKLKVYLNNPDVQQRLKDMLGERAGAFSNSIINVTSGSKALITCDPKTIMQSAMIAASVNLPIDPALGFAAIVPYKATAQFQIMYKGVIQLCIRSGQYETIHDTEVYRDELESYNPITGEIKFRDLVEYKMRPKHDFKDVVGFHVHFKLLKGFKASLYMTKEEVMAHAERYSKAYQYDLSQRKKTCPWSTDPIAMGRKTVILGLLKRYGIMSVEMQDAISQDADTEMDGPRHVDSVELPPTDGKRKKFGLGKEAPTKEEPEEVKDVTELEEIPDTDVAEEAATDGQDEGDFDLPEDFDESPDPTNVQDAKTDSTSDTEASDSAGTANSKPPYTCTKCKTSDKIQIKLVRGKQTPFCMTCISGKNVIENK